MLLKGSAAAGVATLFASAFGNAFSLAGGPDSVSRLLLPTAAAAPLDSDLDILNYALTLEYLETEAYKAINDAGVLSGRAATYFEAFGAHEAEHVSAITATIQQLGGTPVAKPAFDFSGVPTDPGEIVKFFQTVEAVGASAYHGAAPSIRNLDVLTAALQIHANEAEHAAALADLVAPGTELFSPAAFATPRTPDQVLEIVGPWLPTGTGGTAPGMPSTGGGGTWRTYAGGSFANRR
jgi:hypothetical protein